jgi:hypothetical protein
MPRMVCHIFIPTEGYTRPGFHRTDDYDLFATDIEDTKGEGLLPRL